MFWPFAVLSINFIAMGVVMFILGLRSRTGLALNPWWGMRTKKTMVDKETFAKANRAIWRIYIFQSGISFVTGCAILIVGIVDAEAYVPLVVITLGSALVIFLAALFAYIKAHRSIR
ncbi:MULTISPECIES: SdpI family protein [Actinotignum]|uniref:SdpI family protein n=1 Tax=Actinotignum TaxID=1653174 RepID=UPI002550DD35|nr:MULTISPECIES: SdpI family protein [Actinotignum]MDE1537056.1 SdpI family protein [Actinotignum schaalii]MDK6629639.1 SdpI family protein [Actinotignum timonense]MDK7272212.1 SdpI family protein [Actinotignum schaalii]MDY5134104.1 SdpI family protein [Actinotignum timonense]MDY5144530.1 SdpI family protein [Actinotignum timonense]